jgi:hypothetical protein
MATRHERSDSFKQDYNAMREDQRVGALHAMQTFCDTVDATKPGTKPQFPEWISVKSVPAVPGVWQVHWTFEGRKGRATFQMAKVEGRDTVRWRRVGALAVLEEVAGAMLAGRKGHRMLPHGANLVAFMRTRRGDQVFLENERWHGHIRPVHVTQPPTPRGKGTTTMWPVHYSAKGAPTMTEEQVLKVIADAVAFGDLENAPKGTLLSIYDVPLEQAREFGVSEVKVSITPNGRVLSAYPTRGDNVLAVRELRPDELEQQQAAQQPAAQADEQPAFQSSVPQTTFG